MTESSERNPAITFERAIEVSIGTIESTLWLQGFESDPKLVAELAKTDTQYFHRIQFHIAWFIAREEPLPAIYRNWLYGFLTGEIAPPKRPQGPREQPHRIERVISLVSALVELGFYPTRADQGSHKESACDAVATALARTGKQPKSYARVKRVWLNNKDKVPD